MLDGNCPSINPSRFYRGVELTANHRFSNNFYMLASYIYSKLEGNYSGNFSQTRETGQSDPNINADFDYIDLTPNNYGKLRNDRTNQFKLTGTYAFPFGLVTSVNAAYADGRPMSVRSYARPGYSQEHYVIARGSFGNLPSTYNVDLHLEYGLRLGAVTITPIVDVFNLTNFQGTLSRDEVFCTSTGGCAAHVDASGKVIAASDPLYASTPTRLNGPTDDGPRPEPELQPRHPVGDAAGHPDRSARFVLVPLFPVRLEGKPKGFPSFFSPCDAFFPSFRGAALFAAGSGRIRRRAGVRGAASRASSSSGGTERTGAFSIRSSARDASRTSKALLEKGARARLETYRPRASPLLWTTMATGLTPPEHGVVDFQEFDVATGSSLPISGRSRTGPAIWNVASAKGLTSGVVGWWATWPAEAVKGFFVSDRAAPVLFDAATLSQSPGLTWPPELAEGVRLLGRREGAPAYEEVAKYLHVSRAEFDAAVAGGRELENPVTGFRKILGSTHVYAKTALDLYDRNRPDLLMVYFEGTDEIGHVLGKYNPPLLPNVPREEFEKYKDAVALYYAECDRILGEFASRAERDGATLLLVSDHGFKWGDGPADAHLVDQGRDGVPVARAVGRLRPRRARRRPREGAPDRQRVRRHPDPLPAPRPASGSAHEGARPGRTPFRVGARAAARRAWNKAFKVERAAITRNLAAEKKAGEEFAKKLVSLGYLSGASAAAPAVGASGAGDVRMTPFGVSNIGVYYAESGRVKESVPWFEKAIAADPATPTFHTNLADALEKLGRTDAADAEAIKAADLGGEDANDILLARIVKRTESGAGAAGLALLEKAVRELRPARPQLQDALGRLYYDRRRCPDAQRLFEELTVSTPRDPGAWLMLARTRRCTGDVPGARAALDRAARLGGNPAAIAHEMEALGGRP